jgi:hypothetical protein
MEESIVKRKRKTNGNTWPDFPSVPRDTLTKHIMTAGPGLYKNRKWRQVFCFCKAPWPFKKIKSHDTKWVSRRYIHWVSHDRKNKIKWGPNFYTM